MVLLPGLGGIVFDAGDNRLWTQAAGAPWSWLIWALMTVSACFHAWKRQASLPLHLLGAMSLVGVGVMACGVEHFHGDGFVALMFLCGVYACVWVWTNLLVDSQAPPAWLTCTHGLTESVLYAILSAAFAVLLACATFVNDALPIWSAASVALSALAFGLLAYQRRTEIWATGASILMMLAGTILVLHFDAGNPDRWLVAIQVNLAILGATAILRLGMHRYLLPTDVALSQTWQLPVQITIGLAATGVLTFAGLMALVLAPNHPGDWLGVHATWAGWLALGATGIAAIWYVGAAKPQALIHIVALSGLMLGLVVAGTVDSLFIPEIAWLAHHVLTLSWTLLGLLLLTISWASHAQAGLGPQFWPAERRVYLAESLRRFFPEATTRAWVTLCGTLVVVLALRATWVEPATPYWSLGNTFAVSILLGALAVWSRSLFYVYCSGLLVNIMGLLLFTAWSAHRFNLPGPMLRNDEWLSFFLLTQVISFGTASILWSLIERSLHGKGIDLSEAAPLPFPQAALLASIHLLAFGVALANAIHLGGDEVRIDRWLTWAVLGLMIAAALVDSWR